MKKYYKLLTTDPLFEAALTHPSYVNENPQCKDSYQRLEFLGDSVLSLVCADYLYRRRAESAEGYLTDLRAALVRTETLALFSKKLGLHSYIRLSKGEEKNSGRENEHILADVLEAFIGALYLTFGLKEVQLFFKTYFVPIIPEIESQKSYRDAKTLLQEYMQSKKKVTPLYETVGYDDEDKEFIIRIMIHGKEVSRAQGPSKKAAEQAAAKKAIEDLHLF